MKNESTSWIQVDCLQLYINLPNADVLQELLGEKTHLSLYKNTYTFSLLETKL